jgi:hypothetical protein
LIHIALYLLYAAIACFIIYKWRFFELPGFKRIYVFGAFALKVLAGIAVTWVYTNYYTNRLETDIYKYFDDGVAITHSFTESPAAYFKVLSGISIDDADAQAVLLKTENFSHKEGLFEFNHRFIIRLNVVFNVFSYCNVYINTLLIAIISFIGLTALFKAFYPFVSHGKLEQWVFFSSVYLLPSVLFWCSGMLKETIAITAMGLFFYALFKLMQGKHWLVMLSAIVLAMLVLISVKPYVLFAVLVGIWVFIGGYLKGYRSYLYFLFPIGLMGLLVALFPENALGFASKIIEKRNEFVNLSLAENAGSLLDENIYNTSFQSFISILGKAVYYTFGFPLKFNSVLTIPFFVEYVVIIGLCAYLLIKGVSLRQNKYLPIAVMCFTMVAAVWLIIGATAPVLGAIVRYKSVMLPFLLIGILIISNREFTNNPNK